MKDFYLEKDKFVIKDFDKKRTFSSFLPGVAGTRGIPLWAFYVNRGQGIASFGVQDKNGQILEFNPAVTSYEDTATNGFRTFVKVNGIVHEIFGIADGNYERRMYIKRSEFSIEEINYDLGLKFFITYFGLPNMPVAALVRKVEVTNISNKKQQFELVDGLAQLIPYQINNDAYHAVANVLRSWMEVYGLENDYGYYRMRSSSADTAEVSDVIKGNFYISSYEGSIVKPIVDPNLIFGYDNSKRRAVNFENNEVSSINNEDQVTANKVPIGFSCIAANLKASETTTLFTTIGHIHSMEALDLIKDSLVSHEFLNQKQNENVDDLEALLNDVTTKTALPIFDEYIKQNYMDNFLRGGYPILLSDHKIYHLFSRKHGDLERDYNFFSLAPEFYSQGNGNFRDVCQNRRNDVMIKPESYDFSFRMFASLIQLDGYNPLSVNGLSYTIKDESVRKELNDYLFDSNETMLEVLGWKFTPGAIINTMARIGLESKYSDEEIFGAIFSKAEQNIEASFGEGYWIDHWTYILDLVENFEAMFPDRIQAELYENKTIPFYNSVATVLPRSEKICKRNDGVIRRYGSVIHHDHDKIKLANMAEHGSNWLHLNGENVTTNSFGKLLVLAVNKITHLDPFGIGIEMEADKPGWNDAMNGLPGMFGSGVSETIELKRVVNFLLSYVEEQDIVLPTEFNSLVYGVIDVLSKELNDFEVWDHLNNVKEQYRADIHHKISGVETLPYNTIIEVLNIMSNKLDSALDKALELGNGIYPTYIVHEVTKYEETSHIGHYGLPTVKPLEFTNRALPKYLEAPARSLKLSLSKEVKEEMYKKIKASNIYDHELKFYKTSEFLDDETNEVGRGRSFTKGWQERESNFLHMSYKYILGLLKGGMYDKFFEEIETGLTCFMDPEVYGRSPLENSSFIATSVNPDPYVRGQGFVARLSGSTAEMLSIWVMMLAGKKPFVLEDGQLKLSLKPLLSKKFFDENKEVSFNFLSTTKVTYVNESNVNTYEEFDVKEIYVDGKQVKEIKGDLALQVRNKQIKSIKIVF